LEDLVSDCGHSLSNPVLNGVLRRVGNSKLKIRIRVPQTIGRFRMIHGFGKRLSKERWG
jgi:hypothetical protein